MGQRRSSLLRARMFSGIRRSRDGRTRIPDGGRCAIHAAVQTQRSRPNGRASLIHLILTPPTKPDFRNQRLRLSRLSLHADLLAEHHEHSLVSLTNFIEADFTLYVRGL